MLWHPDGTFDYPITGILIIVPSNVRSSSNTTRSSEVFGYWSTGKCGRSEIQKRVTKQVKQIRHLSYSERLKRLNLPTLCYRRHRGYMIEVYKILHNIYDKEIITGILNLLNNTSTRGHSLKLTTQRSRLHGSYGQGRSGSFKKSVKVMESRRKWRGSGKVREF